MLILSYEHEFNLHLNENSFSYERMSTKTRFEKEAKGNSEMAYYVSRGYLQMGLSDPSKVFYVSQNNAQGVWEYRLLDSRLPITLPIPDRLVAAASSLEGSAYQII